MRTATLTAKVNRWLHEHLAMKTPAKLLGGLALGALLVAATGLYFSTNQGGQSGQSEAGNPLGSEQGACYPAYPESGLCPSEFIGIGPAIFDGYNRGLFDWAFPEDLKQDTAGSSLASEQGACYPLYPELGPCVSEFVAATPTIADRNDRGLFDEVLPEDLKQSEAGSRLSGEQVEDFLTEWMLFGAPRQPLAGRRAAGELDEITGSAVAGVSQEPSTVRPLTSEQFEYWPEVGFDSRTYHQFMVEQGKVGKGLSTAKVYAEIDDGEAMVIYGYPASIFYTLNEGKVARPSSINRITCHPEDNC